MGFNKIHHFKAGLNWLLINHFLNKPSIFLKKTINPIPGNPGNFHWFLANYFNPFREGKTTELPRIKGWGYTGYWLDWRALKEGVWHLFGGLNGNLSPEFVKHLFLPRILSTFFSKGPGIRLVQTWRGISNGW